jgi:methylamine dehydrogenase accessory protein MauD
MKKSLVIATISLQVFTLIALGIVGMQLYTTEQTVKNTRSSLSTTIAVMDEVDKENKKAKAQEQKELAALNKPLNIGDQAPAFSLKDEDNKEVALNNYKGQELLLVFTHPTCEHCHEFYPVVNEFMQNKKEVEVLFVQMESTPEQNKLYKQEKNIHAKMAAATTEVIVDYKVPSTPTSIFINAEGKIAGKGIAHTLEELNNLVAGQAQEG